MMAPRQRASTRTPRVINARPEEIYDAFMDPVKLVAWLPPGEMTGKIHEFDGRVGGGYRMSLFYPPTESPFRGKTAEREDRVSVRFVELVPPRRIVEVISFHTSDPTPVRRDDHGGDLRAVAGRHRGHTAVRESPAGPAAGGQ